MTGRESGFVNAALSAAAAIIPGRLKQIMLERAKSLLRVVKGAEGWAGMGCKRRSRIPRLNGNTASWWWTTRLRLPHWDATWQGSATRGAAINSAPPGPHWLPGPIFTHPWRRITCCYFKLQKSNFKLAFNAMIIVSNRVFFFFFYSGDTAGQAWLRGAYLCQWRGFTMFVIF